MNVRTIVYAVLVLVIISIVIWLVRTFFSPPPTPSPTLTPAQRQQNAEHLIEVRSENVKTNLDHTRENVQQYQGEYDSALSE